MSTEHDVLKVTRRMVADLGCTMADLAETVNRQQSALIRTLDNNPTIRILQEVAWALGLGKNVDMHGNVPDGPPLWHLLGMPEYMYVQALGTSFRPNRHCPMVTHNAAKQNKKLTRYATWGRGPDYDPTDKSHLSQVYPAKALEGAGGAPIDSRFIEAPAPEPLHGKTAQGPGGAQRAANQSTAPVARNFDEANELAFEQQMVAQETSEQRQARLSEGAPQGYRLSAKALADAPRSTFALWQQAGWDIDKLIHHGYLEAVEPICQTCGGYGMIGGPSFTNPDEGGERCPDCNYPPKLVTNDPIEARRLEASIGCPEGWILSDKALEVSDDVTYEKLSRAMDVDQLKEEKYLVPRAWLGYD